MGTNKTLWDKRLLGTWKSDRRRTFQHWKPSPGCSASSDQKFKALFGKMIVTWKRGTMLSGFDGDPPNTRPYEVVARDSESVVIRYRDLVSEYLDAEDHLCQIHFVEDYYWIALGSGLCEYFRKIE
jgi:hypothetical protein